MRRRCRLPVRIHIDDNGSCARTQHHLAYGAVNSARNGQSLPCQNNQQAHHNRQDSRHETFHSASI